MYSRSSPEVKRPRLDTGRDIFTQLTQVFDDVSGGEKAKPTPERLNNDGDTAITHATDPADEVIVRI